MKKESSIDMDINSSLSSGLLNSDVTSFNFNESELEKMDSDIEEGRFKKKRK